MIPTASPAAPDGSAPRRALSPLAAALLAIAGNVLVMAIVLGAVAAVLAAAVVVVLGPALTGV